LVNQKSENNSFDNLDAHFDSKGCPSRGLVPQRIGFPKGCFLRGMVSWRVGFLEGWFPRGLLPRGFSPEGYHQ